LASHCPSAQVAACQRHGLDVHLHDARQVTRDSFGEFDAVASVGGFEHLLTGDSWPAAKRRSIASVRRIASVFPTRRFYVQTMVLGDANMIPEEAHHLLTTASNSPKLSRVT